MSAPAALGAPMSAWAKSRRFLRRRQQGLAGSAALFVIGYCALLICLPSQLIFGPLGAPGTPANLWGCAALIWWVCATLGGLNSVRHLTPARVAAGVLALVTLLSYANGNMRGWYAPLGYGQVTDDILSLVPPEIAAVNQTMVSAADRGLISMAGWLGIVLLTSDGIRSWKDLEHVTFWLTWFGTFMATLGIIQFFTGADIASYYQIPGLQANSQFGAVTTRSVLNRVSSTAVHPIEYGVVLGTILPIAIHRAIHCWGQKLVLAPAVLIGFGMMLAVSRSAILVAAAALVVFLIGWPGRWRVQTFILLPIIIVLTRAAVPGLVGTLFSLFHGIVGDPSIQGRTQDYVVVGQIFSEHPLLGRGLLTFVPQYYRVLDNEWLDRLIEGGVVGISAVVLIFAVGFLSARGAYRHALDPTHRHLGLSISAAIAGVFVSYFTFDAWSFPMAAGITFLMFGLAGAVWNITDTETDYRRSDEPGSRLRDALHDGS